MMKRIKVEEKHNGYVVTINDMEYVFKNTEEILLIEFIGEKIMDAKIQAELK